MLVWLQIVHTAPEKAVGSRISIWHVMGPHAERGSRIGSTRFLDAGFFAPIPLPRHRQNSRLNGDEVVALL